MTETHDPSPYRTILHVDMDAFYTSVEQHDDPALRGRPVIVGGPSRRGVVAAASYEVRPFGVHSAMSMAEALRRCPHAIVLPGRRERYVEVSRQVFSVFHRYTPLVEGLSLDEAFLDVTASRSLHGSGADIAASIKRDIRRETGLTASAGVAPCKFVAKIASDLRKPDGLVIVAPDDVSNFLSPLAIERMWGIGVKSAPRIHAAGFHTIGDLAAATPERLEALLGVWGRDVHSLSRGVDRRAVTPGVAPKSIGAEETFERDLSRRDEIERELLGQASRVAQRMVREGWYGSTVTVKIKHSDFSVESRRVQLVDPAADTDTIYRAAVSLLDRFELRGAKIRLTGISMSDLQRTVVQRSLFGVRDAERRDKIERLAARVADRFGDATVTRATLLSTRGRVRHVAMARAATMHDGSNEPKRGEAIRLRDRRSETED